MNEEETKDVELSPPSFIQPFNNNNNQGRAVRQCFSNGSLTTTLSFIVAGNKRYYPPLTMTEFVTFSPR